MKELLFYGYYGKHNTGDDAFIEVSAWGAKKYWNNIKSKFLTQNVPIIQNPCDYTGRSYFKGDHLYKDATAIISADAFICAGGSTFHSQINTFSPKYIASLKKKYLTKFKLGAIGVSLGPYKTVNAEKDNIELLRRFDFLALRDKASYEIARQYNLPYEPIEAFDLAALLPEVYSELPISAPSLSKRILGICICNYESYLKDGDLKNEKRRNAQIENFLLQLAHLDQDLNFRFFIFNGNAIVGDKKMTISLATKIKLMRPDNVEIVQYDPKTFNTWNKIKECNLVLSTRLHAAIFACFANVPFFLVEYHRKCSDFLIDVGYNEDYRIFDAQFDRSQFSSLIIEILFELRYVKPSKISFSINKALLNFTKVNLCD